MRDIGKNIRDLRQRKNMTQDDLAEKLYVTRQTVSNYELGRTRPDIDMLVKIAEVLDTDVNSVIYGVPEAADRRRTLARLALLIAGNLLAFFIYRQLSHWVLQARKATYITPRFTFWIAIVLKPAVYALLGWTLLEAVGSFTKITPFSNGVSKWIRRALWLLAALYLLLMLPCLTGFSWQIFRFWSDAALFLLRNNAFFGFLAGILLWLFRSPILKKQKR